MRIDQLPWQLLPARQLGDNPSLTVQTGPFGAQLHADDYVEHGVPFILIKNIKDGYVDPSGMPHVSTEDAARLSPYRLEVGDVVFSRVGRVGSCFLVEEEHDGWVISGQLLRLRLSRDSIYGRFLLHWLLSSFVRDHIASASVGTTRQSINTAILGNVPIPILPFPEQRRIAEILDTLDEAIRKTEQVIAKLQQMKQGLLHDLLTRGIDENGELRDPERHPEQFKDSVLGRIPRGWEILRLGDVVRDSKGLIQTGPFGSQLHAHEYVAEGVPVIMPQDIQGEIVDSELIARITSRKADELSRHRLNLNDVVIARRGDLSRCLAIGMANTGWLCGTGCLLVRLPESSVIASWLASVYRHDLVQSQVLAQAVGSTMVNLNGKILASLLVPVPSLPEQRQCVDRMEAIMQIISAEQSELQKNCTLKQGLMDDLLTGHIRVAATKGVTA